MIHKAYKDECYIIGFCLPNGAETTALRQVEYFDGYVDVSPEERKKFEKIDKAFWDMQEELSKRWKKK